MGCRQLLLHLLFCRRLESEFLEREVVGRLLLVLREASGKYEQSERCFGKRMKETNQQL